MDGTDFVDISYQVAHDPQSTNIIDTLPRNTVPISTMLRRINREDSRNLSDQEGEEEEEGGRRERHSGRSKQKKSRRTNFSWTTHQFSWSTRQWRTYLKGKLHKGSTRSSRSEPAVELSLTAN